MRQKSKSTLSPEERIHMKMQANLQGEIGSEISTIEHAERSQVTTAALELGDLEKSRRWQLEGER